MDVLKNISYKIIKDINLKDGGSIKSGRLLQLTHGLYYIDGYLLPNEYQDDFNSLINYEREHGWNYLTEIDFNKYGNHFSK